MSSELEFFIYDHEQQMFNYYQGDKSIFMTDDVTGIPKILTEEGMDGVLILDEGHERWFLGFSENLGIVAQRTARRQADSIVRSGTKLPDGFWLKKPYPMEELSDANIGDLWKTVQQKYVKSDLKGLQLDEETGIPIQIKERADRLKQTGHTDELTDAKLEKEEAEKRRRAKIRSEGIPVAKQKKVKKEKKSVKVSTIPEAPPVKKGKKKTEKKIKEEKKTKEEREPKLSKFKIEVLAEYVETGDTVVVVKGLLTKETGKTKNKTLILSQSYLSKKDWNEIVVFLDVDDTIKIHYEKIDNLNYVTQIKK